MNFSRILIVIVALAALVAGGYWFLSGGGGGADTVLLVTVGGLREDAATASPAFQRLVKEGRSGALEVSVPLASSAAAEVLTGMDPLSADALFDDLILLPAGSETLAGRFSGKGYETVAIVADGALSLLTGLYRGFDEVVIPSSPFDQPILPDESHRVRAPRSGEIPATGVAQLFAQWLQGRGARERIFAWVHLADPSHALTRAAGETTPRAAYDVAVGTVDAALDALIEGLERSGRASGATVVICGLHGEALGESGEVRHGLFPDDTTARVPLVVKGLRDADPLPSRLRDLPDLILGSRGESPLANDSSDETWRATWIPARSYGWEVPAARLEGGSWSPISASELPSPAGTPRELESPDQDERRAVLALMRDAHEAALSGELTVALGTLAQVRERAPRAMAPRRLGLSILRPTRRDPKAEWAEQRARLLGEIEGIGASSAVGSIDVARSLAESGERSRALDKALELAPRGDLTPGQRWAVAELLASLDALEASVDLAESVAATFGADKVPELWEWIGDKLSRSGNAFRASQAYEKAMRVPRARTANLLAKRADALQSLGENDEALAHYGEAVNLDPTYRYPHLRAGELLLKLERFNEAAHALASSVATTGRTADDALARARVLEQRGMVRAAAGEIYEAAQEATGDPRLQVSLGRLLVTAGEPARAEEFIQNVLSANPDAPAALVQWARIQAAQGRVKEALVTLQKLEPLCGRDGARAVRADPLFVGPEADPRMGALARSFASERFPMDEGAGAGPREGW